MSGTPSPSNTSRRTVLRAAAWATPAIAIATAAPAMAVSPEQVQVLFDGGGGSNSYFNTAYVNLLPPGGVGSPTITTTHTLVFTIDIIGLNTLANDERSMGFAAHRGSTFQRAAYNATTRTTRIIWTVPAGSTINGTARGAEKTNLEITFRDGASSTSGAGRITNKIVVRSVTGGTVVGPNQLPADSSVIKDYYRGAVSPDGIY